MRISLLVNNFPPEIGSAADLFYQLALAFNRSGHIVKVFTTEPRRYNLGGGKKIKTLLLRRSCNNKVWKIEITSGVYTYRARLLPLIYPRSGTNSFFRELEHVLQPLTFFAFVPYLASSDIILVYSPPLLLGYLSALFGKLLGVPVVVNVQDIHPVAIVDLGLLKNKLLIHIFENIEKQMYKYSSAITVHSNGNKEIVIRHGADPKKVFTIFNACYIPPPELLSKSSYFRRKYSLEGKFVVTYAGIMSFSQDLDTVVKAAKLLSNKDKDIVFLLVGNGPRRRELEILSRELDTKNVIFLPFQEGEDYWYLLSASDVCLVSLKKSKVKTPVVPRKLEDIMAAGRPVIANVPLNGDVSNFIKEAQCGIAVESESPLELAEAIQKVKNMHKEIREQLGHNGRKYAIDNFSPQAIARRYESLFNVLVH
jgi:glycosyltransferase involved in cell wall biosynthesis